MKYNSEYLFDHPASKYEPLQSDLAAIKIADAKRLLKELAEKRAHGFESHEMAEITIRRYQSVEKALSFWENLK